jgi:hypothetical protein
LMMILGQLLNGWTYAILTIGCSSYGKWKWHNTHVFLLRIGCRGFFFGKWNLA